MPLDEAWSRLHAAVVEHLGPTPRATDVVDSFDALGRVLAEDGQLRPAELVGLASTAELPAALDRADPGACRGDARRE